jgi:hypothetical protein
MAGPPAWLDVQVKGDLNGFALSPQPPGSEPKLTADEALDLAWAEEGSEGNPTSVQLTYAYLTWGNYTDTPVWLLTCQGTCILVGSGVGRDTPQSDSSPEAACWLRNRSPDRTVRTMALAEVPAHSRSSPMIEHYC